MDGNFLAQLFGSVQRPVIPGTDPAGGRYTPGIAAVPDLAGALPRLDPSMLPSVQPNVLSVAAPDVNINPYRQPAPSMNVLQELAGAAPTEPAPAAIPEVPQGQDDEPPRKRRSLLDTVGRIADVLARVGDREALYEPALNAREDRSRQMDVQDLQYTRAEQEIAEGSDEATTRRNILLGNAMRGLQAIQAGGGDIMAAWPTLAERAGVSPEETARLAQIFQQNPQIIPALAASTGSQREFGTQPFLTRDAQGNIRAYQLGRDGTQREISLGANGEQPIDPLQFVNTGGAQVGVGRNTGTVRRILPMTERPGAAADRGSRERIAAMRGRGGTPAAQERAAAREGGIEAALGNLGEIRQVYEDLNRMGALVSPSRGTGANIAARVRASGIGQMAEGAIGTEAQTLRDRVASIRPALMQSIARATGMTGRQLDSNADVRLFMQTVTDPTTSYEANQRAIAGLERFLRSHAGQGSGDAAPARQPQGNRRPSGRRVTPATPRGGWGRATVVGN